MFAAAAALSAHADQIDDHNALVNQFIQQRSAPPLIADCAAHAAFVVPTSPRYDHVEFMQNAFDPQHSMIEPWQRPFDDQKQRITVDTMVTLTGLGYLKDSKAPPDLLTFKCGYEEGKLLAFSDNEPRLASPRSGSRTRHAGTTHRHVVSRKKTTGTHTTTARSKTTAHTTTVAKKQSTAQ